MLLLRRCCLRGGEASFTASSAMVKIASRVLAAAIKRPLWQKLAPSTPQTASNSLPVRPAQAAGRSARSSKPSSARRMPVRHQSLSRGWTTKSRWSAPAFTMADRNGMPIGSSRICPSPVSAIAFCTSASARNLAAPVASFASTKLRATASAAINRDRPLRDRCHRRQALKSPAGRAA